MIALVFWVQTMSAWPRLDPVALLDVSLAAAERETVALPADLLLAISYVESRHDRCATSRRTPEGRRTGRWPSERPGRGFAPSFFCGRLQAKARTWAACLALRDGDRDFAVGVLELERWMKRCRGRVRCALAGHGCGNAGLKTGCRRYPERVLRQRSRLQSAARRRGDGRVHEVW